MIKRPRSTPLLRMRSKLIRPRSLTFVATLALSFASVFGCTDDRLSLGRMNDAAGSSGSSATSNGSKPSVAEAGISGEDGGAPSDGGSTSTGGDSSDAGKGAAEPIGDAGSTNAPIERGGRNGENGGFGGSQSAGERATDGGGGSGGKKAGGGGMGGSLTAGAGGSPAAGGGTGSSAAGAGGGTAIIACGNGKLEALEKCDDGNVKGADGCSATCQIEAGFACAGEPSLCSKNPSCVGLPRNCGPTQDGDCCASSVIPAGSFYRGNTALFPTAYPASVSSFRMDTYEVTLGRFRKFVDAYAQNMIANGSGKNPNNPADTGWDAASWNGYMFVDRAALIASFASPVTQTWTPTPLSALDETRAINFINWYTAEAFCIWDGGRLPTYAEWNYAAGGGSEQRTYPWGNTRGTGHTPAVTICSIQSNGEPNPCSVRENIAPVGSAPAGNGKWGQADLSGNLEEWVQDSPINGSTNNFGPVPCNDCAYLDLVHLLSGHIRRMFCGGDFGLYNPSPSYFFYWFAADHHGPFYGMRCVRGVP